LNESGNAGRHLVGVRGGRVTHIGIYKIFISSAFRPSRTLMRFSRILHGEDTHDVVFPSAERKEAPLIRSAPFIASAVNNNNQGSRSMMDIILVGIGVLFFLLCVAYTKACDSL
jgi:hypothetical protein